MEGVPRPDLSVICICTDVKSSVVTTSPCTTTNAVVAAISRLPASPSSWRGLQRLRRRKSRKTSQERRPPPDGT